MITSSGKYPTTETDADWGMDPLTQELLDNLVLNSNIKMVTPTLKCPTKQQSISVVNYRPLRGRSVSVTALRPRGVHPDENEM
ncbi:hypothetical protein TNCV_124441 [Trichonephila clavipes]|nr:hypothetical protein TNCV_124441 [Trichonephila clavipes]